MDIAIYIIASLFYWLFAGYFLFGVYFLIAGDESLSFHWKNDDNGIAKLISGLFFLGCVAIPVLFVIGTISYF